jgi:hypothetical protein
MKRLNYLLIVSMIALSTLSLAQTNDVTELSSRFLNPDPTTTMMLVPGEFPKELGIDLPLPEDSQVIGSIVFYRQDGSFSNAQTVLDSSLTAEASFAFFKGAFEAKGWSVYPDYQATGFVAEQTNRGGMVCPPDSSVYVFLNAAHFKGKPTDVRLSINPDTENGICANPAYTTTHFEGQSPLPLLLAPEGSEFSWHSSLQLELEASSTAILKTSLSREEVLAHYAGQLGAANWERVNDSGERWQRTDANEVEWEGVLNVEALPNNACFLSFVLIVKSRG